MQLLEEKLISYFFKMLLFPLKEIFMICSTWLFDPDPSYLFLLWLLGTPMEPRIFESILSYITLSIYFIDLPKEQDWCLMEQCDFIAMGKISITSWVAVHLLSTLYALKFHWRRYLFLSCLSIIVRTPFLKRGICHLLSKDSVRCLKEGDSL